MKKLITIIVAIASVSAFIPNTSHATPTKTNKNKTIAANNTDASVVVTNLGQKDDYVFLRIDLQQGNATPSMLRILDGSANELHAETVNGKSFRRIIKILPEEFATIEVVYATKLSTTAKRYDLNTVTYTQVRLVETTN